MRGFGIAAAAVALGAGSVLADLTPITVKGNAFFQGSDRFYIRGVDYYPGGSSSPYDPLANTTSCKRDIPLFKELGINTVRIYTVDNAEDHDECMQLLDDAGIYLILDVNTPKFSIDRDYPIESYNEVYLQHVFATVDVFAKYPNTLGFFAANEVVNRANNTAAATVIKAVIRDLRAYIKARVSRPIPVGYSAADVAENRMEIAHYMNCGAAEERSDFLAINDYSWCGQSSFTVSGWDQKVKNYTDYSIPIFMSEFGCIEPRPRRFDELSALYSRLMTPVFSGGLVYEFTMEDNGYGIVNITGPSTAVKLADFNVYKAQLAKYPAPEDDGGYKQTGSPSTCPGATDLWAASDTLPAVPSLASAYFKNGAGAPKGTSGPSNQRGPQSSGTPSGTATGGQSTQTSKAAAADSLVSGVGMSTVVMLLSVWGVLGALGAGLVL